MKNNFILLSLVIFSLLGFASFVLSAEIIRLPNPLCTQGSHPNCINNQWVLLGYDSEYACNQDEGVTCINSFPDIITVITDYVLALIAGLAVIMFIWAGILFVTSAGNEGRIGSARKALWWAVVGTAIALAGKGLVEVIKAVIGSGS